MPTVSALPPGLTAADVAAEVLAAAIEKIGSDGQSVDVVLCGMASTDGGMSVVWSLAAQGIAVILVEHVMTAVRALCSRVVVMNAGVKIAEGPPVEVLRDAEVIRAYLGDDDA